MLHNKTILVAGGDLRQAHLSKLFSSANRVYTLGLEKAEGAGGTPTTLSELWQTGLKVDYIILPMPVLSDETLVNTPFSGKKLAIDALLDCANPDTIVLGGRLPHALIQKLEERGLAYSDYLDREELAVLNAVPTAEGAIQIAMEELPTTIFGMKILLIGYGRISKVLARLLKALGAEVTVSARKFSDLAWIQANGFRSAHTADLAEAITGTQLIINTVPAVVLNEELLSRVEPGCLLIDLASKPGGIDFTTANRMGLKAVWALSLPGKVAPITAGKIIFDTIQNIEAERRQAHE